MKSETKLLLGVVALVVLIVISSTLYNDLSKKYIKDDNITPVAPTQSGPQIMEAVPAPDFSFDDSEGNEVRLSDFIGKPIVINFWASWCPPCKRELPDFNKVANEMGDDVIFLFINSPSPEETVEVALDYIKGAGFTFPVYFDTRQEGAIAFNNTSIPTTIFIDKEGNVATRAMGLIDEETLRRGIELIQ